MDTVQLLNDLRRGWIVNMTSTSAGWLLEITERNRGTVHVYQGVNLDRIVRFAWAGERGGVVP